MGYFVTLKLNFEILYVVCSLDSIRLKLSVIFAKKVI